MLDIKAINKTFNPGTINANHALKDLSLHIADGESIAVIGGNGAGKSTLLNAVAGVWSVDSGTIHLGDVEITHLPEHKRAKHIGRVFQDPMLGTAGDMQIEENLALAARRGAPRGLRIGITRAEREKFREMLRILDLGLENRLTDRAGLLSGGQRQALTLLMATLESPKLLLLDEHTAALDPATAEKVLELTKSIVAENGITCLMITHNIPSALQLGNRTIMMNNGKIVLELSGEQRRHITTEQLLQAFHSQGAAVSDRILFSAGQ